MLLAQVTDRYDDHGGDTLAEEWPPAKHFHEYLQDKIIQREVKNEREQVTKELYPSP